MNGSLWSHRRLIRDLARRDLKTKYASTVFNFYWAILNPLFMLAVYTLVFSVFLRIRLPEDARPTSFALYLYCGLVPWIAFQEALSRSAAAITEHANLIKKVVFPSQVLPVYLCASSLLNQLVSTVILVVAGVALGMPPGYALALFPVVLLLQVLLTLGLSWFVAAFNVYFRDTVQIVNLLLLIGIFATPIFYPDEMVPDSFRFLLAMNPLAVLVRLYRFVLLDRAIVDPGFWRYDVPLAGAISLLICYLGYRFFKKCRREFSDLL